MPQARRGGRLTKPRQSKRLAPEWHTGRYERARTFRDTGRLCCVSANWSGHLRMRECAVEMVKAAIAFAREHRIRKLLVNMSNSLLQLNSALCLRQCDGLQTHQLR